MKYLGTRNKQYDPVVTQDISGKQDKATLEADVAAKGFTKNTGTYSKPSGGIPKSDLANDVQASLGKADTALQEHQSLAAYRTAGAQDIIDNGKQDKITSTNKLEYSLISGTPTIPTVPTNVSYFTNDAGYLTLATLPKYIENNAGAHNAVYRGKNLGSAVTAAQWSAIQAGTFEDLFIGDYWTINGVNWRIAAFDYYYKTGDTPCTTHHVVIVPDTNLYTHVMNDTNITTGGYIGSKMYTEGLAQAKTTINNAFGSSHILSHRQFLVNAVTNGKPSGGSWYDSTVELMTEQNVYGGKIFGAGNDGSTIPYLYTIDKSQFSLFAHDPSMISNRQWFWLRDVVSAALFALVLPNGSAYCTAASSGDGGVRPAFSIKS